jgi:hypothetical protein
MMFRDAFVLFGGTAFRRGQNTINENGQMTQRRNHRDRAGPEKENSFY